MIKDDSQLTYSKEWANKFTEANRKLRANNEKRLKDPDGWQLTQDSNDALRLKLVAEIEEYEALVAHNPNKQIVLEIENLNYLPDLLIKARIAFKITQEELAALSDHTVDEIKTFEDKNYHNASFVNFLSALDALGIELVDGKFVAVLDDFYKQELVKIRREKSFSKNLHIASNKS
ncbi:MAG: hypothetical protein PUP91_11530 [Rhizonema sp. PD37]|nr:hypothetical protein [Rhizonema sp. PD37]